MKNSILEKARWLRDVALATSKNNGARVAREWLKYAAMFVMLFTIGSGNAWGAALGAGYTKITNITSLSAGDKVVLYCDDASVGVTGYSGSDAQVSSTEANWIQFTVEKSGSNYFFKTGNNYIQKQTSNMFTIGATSQSDNYCTVNSSGVLCINSRYLCKNNNYYRMYTSISSSYKPFYVYKVAVATPSVTPDPTSLDWGTVLQGSSQEKKTISITGANLTEGSLTISATGGYSVTPTSQNVNGTLDATDLTVTPPSTSTTGEKNGKVTISGGGLASNVEIDLSMTVNAASTVTWMNNGSEYTTTLVANGAKPEFPSNPSSCDGTSTTFVGWTPTPWSGKLDDVSAKTIYTSGSAMPDVSGPVTYHAVFAKETSTLTPVPNTWTRITSTSQLTDGATVMLVQYYSDFAINNTPGATSCTANDEITNSNTDLRWIAVKSGSKWKFKTSGGAYLSTNALANNTNLGLNQTYDEWTISADDGGTTGSNNIYTNTNCFRLNNGSDLEYYSGVFKLYTWSLKYSSAYPFYIYIQKTTGSPTYSQYLTTCQACVAPDHVNISGRWDRFGGEAISLTATPYDGSDQEITTGITGYQWQKYYNSTWNDIAGATSATYTKSNCDKDDSGSYRCVVSTGATCSTASNGFQVKVYVLECYTDGTTTYNFTRIGDTQAGTCQINLAAGNHAFKFHADNDYYGNKGTINEDVSNWVCSTSQGNLTIAAGLGGTFTINMEYSTSGSSSKLGEPEISVTYPRKTIYLTPGVWNTGGAKFAFYYFRKEGETIYGEGFTDFITADDCGSYAEIPQWNGVKINAVRLNSNTTASDLTNSANHYKAAWDKKWNQTSNITVTSNNSISITGWGPQNGDSPYDYGTYSTPTYTISYAAGTGGSGSKDSESKTCGVDFVLPNSAVFTRTGYKQTGWATEDGGAQAYDLGGSYATNAAQTFYPFWTEATYSVTLTTNGGTINAGNVTSYTYGTGATLPADVTKAHATFQGWYASSTCEGERVYSIGASEFGDKTYWAKWEAITYTVTWKANGSIVRTDSNVAEGGKVASVPSAPADLTTDPNGCDAEFAGWVIETNDPGALSISSQTSAPAGLFTDVAGSPTITGNVTFVAIYRQEQ